MANPNIAAATSIYGNNTVVFLSNTSVTSVITNAAASGKVYKVNSVIVSNTNSTTPVTVSIELSGVKFVSSVAIPANSSLIVVDKTSNIYVKENQVISAQAGTGGDLYVVASWEEIS